MSLKNLVVTCMSLESLFDLYAIDLNLWVRLVACIWRTRLPGCSLALFGCLDLPLGLAALVQDSPPGLALEKRQNRPFFLGLARSVRRLVR
jgi:hypothetical protein